MDKIISFYDGFLSFFSTINLNSVIKVFWFFFIIELPRYYLMDIGVMTYRRVTRKQRKTKKEIAREKLYFYKPFVSIIAPGRNEGENIYNLVKSLREQTYKNFEIIIADDGSNDASSVICTDLQKSGYIDRYLRLNVRGGKASAANYALYYASGEFVIHLDADVSLNRDAIENILIPFYYNDKIKAVGGTVKVRNWDESICTSLQQLEYLQMVMLGRTVTSTLGICKIISGAFGAFRTDALKEVGGWDIGPGLDGDITQKIRKSGGRIYFEPEAICLTNVPSNFHKLSKQRIRWSKSLVRFRIRKHRDILLPTQNFLFANFFANIDNILFNFVFDFVWAYYMLNLLFVYRYVIWNLFIIKLVLMLFVRIISFTMVLALSDNRKEDAKVMIYLPIYGFYVAYYMRIIRLIADFKEIFFFSSYKDSWNPAKTSRFARLERM